MTRTLVLENDNMMVATKIQDLLAWKFSDTEIKLWLNFGTAFAPEKRDKSAQRLMELKSGDNIVVKTNLQYPIQIEWMLILLDQLKEKDIQINIYIDCKPKFSKRVNQYLSTPISEFEKYEKSGHSMTKEQFNRLVRSVLNYHKVIQMTGKYYLGEDFWTKSSVRLFYDEVREKCIEKKKKDNKEQKKAQ